MSACWNSEMLRITKQPKVKKNYWEFHGQIHGDGTGDFPMLRLAVPKSKYVPDATYYILCTLHSYAANNDRQAATDGKMLPLSEHFIVERSTAGGDDEYRHTGHKNIFEPMTMQKSLNNENVMYTFELIEHRIVLVALGNDNDENDGRWRSWNELKLQLIQMQLELLDANVGQKYEEIEVCFGFTAFEKLPYNEHTTRITSTLYSNGISLNAGLQLQHLVPEQGNTLGGDAVVLFLNSLKLYDKAMVKVYAIELRSGRRIDIDNIDILPKQGRVLRNCFWDKNTIIFQTPTRPTYLQRQVYLEVYIPSTGETSNSVQFYYQRNRPGVDDYTPSRSKETFDAAPLGNSIEISDPTESSVNVIIRTRNPKWIVIHDSVSKDFHQYFGDIFNDCLYVVSQFPTCSPSYRVLVDNGFKMVIPTNVVLLSEAIASSFKAANVKQLLRLTSLTARKRRCKSLAVNEYDMVALDALEHAMDFFQAYNELMIAEENRKQLYPRPAQKTEYQGYFMLADGKDFRPMIDGKCSVVETDLKGNTPLHTAIMLKHTESLEQFKNIFLNYVRYSKDFQRDLKELFSVYNAEDHTVMHAAIWNNMEDLVEAMLVFCQKNSIKLKGCRVSGRDESILQLAVNNKLANIAGRILHYFSEAKTKDGLEPALNERDAQADEKNITKLN